MRDSKYRRNYKLPLNSDKFKFGNKLSESSSQNEKELNPLIKNKKEHLVMNKKKSVDFYLGFGGDKNSLFRKSNSKNVNNYMSSNTLHVEGINNGMKRANNSQ